MRPFEVITGGRGQRPLVCTWCGASFAQRNQLQGHWAGNGACRKNRMVNNPTQVKDSTTFGQMPMCACGHDGDSHHRKGGGCVHCICLVFSLAGFRP